MAVQEVHPDADDVTERSERWASTMEGTADSSTGDGVRTAHADSTARAGSAGVLGREDREGDHESFL